MRTFSSFQKRKVVTADGRSLGRCHDLRGERTSGSIRITGLCVGRGGWLAHLGVSRHDRHDVIPWDAVIRIEGKRIVVRNVGDTPADS